MSIIKNVQMIDVNDWDDLVESTYNRPYCFQQQDGCKSRGVVDLYIPQSEEEAQQCAYNNCIEDVKSGKKIGIPFKEWINTPLNTSQSVYSNSPSNELWWHRCFYPSVEEVAYDLCKKGLLHAGKYLINIDW